MGRTVGKPCLGLGSRTGIPNSRPLPARYADRAQGTFFERALEGMEQGTCRLTRLIFPFIWLGNMLPDFITNKSILTPLSLIITSLSNFAFMLILVSGVVFAFYKTNLHDGLMKITPYGKMSLTNYITQSIVGSMLYYNWGFALHNQFGITASCLAGIVFFHLAILFLPLVDESPLSRSDGIYMETGNLAEISQEPKSARICL